MRAVATAGIIAAAMFLQPETSRSVHTIPQQDPWRSAHEPSPASVSADGRYVAFTSFARLDGRDMNDRPDIYVLDRATGQVSLESVPPAGEPRHAENRHPRLSADGRLLVYERSIGSGSEIVLRDRVQRTFVLVPQRAFSSIETFSSSPAISRDGRIVAFASTATDLVEGEDRNGRGEDVYVFDRLSSVVERVSVDANGKQSAVGVSVAPTVSADGRYVAFASTADLAFTAATPVAPLYRRVHQVYAFDRISRSLRLISRGINGEPANDASWSPALSADGRSLAFVSNATNLVTDDRNHSMDVFVADMTDGRIELVSRTAPGDAANGRSGAPAISDDGSVVAFQSEASDMLCGRRCTAESEDLNLLWDIFIRDRRNGTMRRVSRDAGRDWMEPSVGPAIDASGSVIVFSSRHPMDPTDTKNDLDLFLCASRPSPR